MSRPAGGEFRDDTENVIALAELTRETPMNIGQHLILMEWHAREANRKFSERNGQGPRPSSPGAAQPVRKAA